MDVGYNVLPGEIFLGRGRAFNSALYVTVGMGDVKFADQDQFALNFGVGDRVLITDWLAMHLDVRDHVFEIGLVRRRQERAQHRSRTGLDHIFLVFPIKRRDHAKLYRKILQALRNGGNRHRIDGIRRGRRRRTGPAFTLTALDRTDRVP